VARERVREWAIVCVCVCVCESESVSARESARMHKSVCVCVYMCVRSATDIKIIAAKLTQFLRISNEAFRCRLVIPVFFFIIFD
jgi:hypothetical protein